MFEIQNKVFRSRGEYTNWATAEVARLQTELENAEKANDAEEVKNLNKRIGELQVNINIASGRFGGISNSASEIFVPSNPMKSPINAAERQLIQDFLAGKVQNTNTVSADLKRVAIVQVAMRALKRRLLPLMAFCTKFDGVRLEGTDQVAVPYYPLDEASSKDFVAADGYVFDQNTSILSKLVTINKRKYKPILVTSAELQRIPVLDLVKLGTIAGEKLAEDVLTDIFSVITAANYPDVALLEDSSSFDSDDVADFRKKANQAEWPKQGRSLVLDSEYDCNLVKDPSVKNAMNFGSAQPIQNGTIPNILGFDYFESPHIPSNSENLKGFIAHQSAVIVAFSNVKPSEEVAQHVTFFEEVDPEWGLTLAYRAWGDATLDATKRIIECSYGYTKGLAEALQRIVHP